MDQRKIKYSSEVVFCVAPSESYIFENLNRNSFFRGPALARHRRIPNLERGDLRVREDFSKEFKEFGRLFELGKISQRNSKS